MNRPGYAPRCFTSWGKSYIKRGGQVAKDTKVMVGSKVAKIACLALLAQFGAATAQDFAAPALGRQQLERKQQTELLRSEIQEQQQQFRQPLHDAGAAQERGRQSARNRQEQRSLHEQQLLREMRIEQGKNAAGGNPNPAAETLLQLQADRELQADQLRQQSTP